MRRRQPSVASCCLASLLVARCAKRDLARELGVPQQYLWNWLSGHCRPPRQVRAMIAKRFGIAPGEWTRIAPYSMRRAAERVTD